MDWVSLHPLTVGAITLVLMWGDWLLTVLQEREKRAHHDVHYQSYPIDTTEGSPLLQRAVRQARLASTRHLLIALVLSATVAAAFVFIPASWQPLYLGYTWGLFLVVGTAHLGNLLGYWASRRGLHGKLYVHQRTGYLIQAGRHFALTVLLIVLAAASASQFMVGLAVAGLTSTVRQFLWLRRVPALGAHDRPPEVASTSDDEHEPVTVQRAT